MSLWTPAPYTPLPYTVRVPKLRVHGSADFQQTFQAGANVTYQAADAAEDELLRSLYVQGLDGVYRASLGNSTNYRAEVLKDSPLFYYRISETSISAPGSFATNALADQSGNNRPGALTQASGVLPGWTSASGGTSDGDTAAQVQDVLRAPYLIPNTNTPNYSPYVAFATLTFECLTNLIPEGNGQMLWASSAASDGFPYFYVQDTGAAVLAAWAPRGNTGGSVSWASPLAGWVRGSWNHVAMTWNGATKTAELFINGTSLGTRVSTVDVATPAFGMIWGNWYQSTSVWAMYNGSKLDEVATYGSILSPARIAAHSVAR